MNESPTVMQFRVRGMTCAEEVGVLKRELGPLAGEGNLAFDILNGKMTVAAAGEGVTAEAVVAAVGRTGMRAEAWRDGAAPAREGGMALTVASGVSTLAGFMLHAWEAGGVCPWLTTCCRPRQAGLMLAFRWKTLSGSHSALMRASRPYFSTPYAAFTRSSSYSDMKFT